MNAPIYFYEWLLDDYQISYRLSKLFKLEDWKVNNNDIYRTLHSLVWSLFLYIYQNTSSWNKTIIYNMSVACMRDRYIDPNFQILCMHSYSSPYNYLAMLFWSCVLGGMKHSCSLHTGNEFLLQKLDRRPSTFVIL